MKINADILAIEASEYLLHNNEIPAKLSVKDISYILLKEAKHGKTSYIMDISDYPTDDDWSYILDPIGFSGVNVLHIKGKYIIFDWTSLTQQHIITHKSEHAPLS